MTYSLTNLYPLVNLARDPPYYLEPPFILFSSSPAFPQGTSAPRWHARLRSSMGSLGGISHYSTDNQSAPLPKLSIPDYMAAASDGGHLPRSRLKKQMSGGRQQLGGGGRSPAPPSSVHQQHHHHSSVLLSSSPAAAHPRQSCDSNSSSCSNLYILGGNDDSLLDSALSGLDYSSRLSGNLVRKVSLGGRSSILSSQDLEQATLGTGAGLKAHSPNSSSAQRSFSPTPAALNSVAQRSEAHRRDARHEPHGASDHRPRGPSCSILETAEHSGRIGSGSQQSAQATAGRPRSNLAPLISSGLPEQQQQIGGASENPSPINSGRLSLPSIFRK